jgi:hypothetical protein
MSTSSCRPYRGHSGLICPRHTHHSEILYIVCMTLKCVINTLYVVFVLIWLHLSFKVKEACSLKLLENCYA